MEREVLAIGTSNRRIPEREKTGQQWGRRFLAIEEEHFQPHGLVTAMCSPPTLHSYQDEASLNNWLQWEYFGAEQQLHCTCKPPRCCA